MSVACRQAVLRDLRRSDNVLEQGADYKSVHRPPPAVLSIELVKHDSKALYFYVASAGKMS